MTFEARSDSKRERVAPSSSSSCSPACRMFLVLPAELLVGERADVLEIVASIY
jgi:hypothetical protein